MDPVGVKLTPEDTSAPDFPIPHVFAVYTAPPMPGDDETVEGDPDSAEYLIGEHWRPTPGRPLHSTRCVATARSTGERCRRWAVIGFSKCEKHSGYDRLANLKSYRERVIERARLDLLRTGPYAVEALAELVRDTEINPAVRLKASTEVLDRIGIKGGSELTVEVVSNGELSPAETIRARLDRLASIASSVSSGAADESEIMEAELVPEEDDDDAA